MTRVIWELCKNIRVIRSFALFAIVFVVFTLALTVVKFRAMKAIVIVVLLPAIAVLLMSCGQAATPTPAISPPPTATPVAQAATPSPSPRATSTPRQVTPIPTPTPTVTATPVIYVVQSGDTLLRIANEFEISTDALQAANGISDPRFLQIGQVLVIPPPEPGPEITASPTPTPFPLDVTRINFLQSGQGNLWCLGAVENPGSIPLTEVVVEASLLGANGELLAREAAYTQLDVVMPNQSVPFAVLFTDPPAEFAQFQVVPVSAAPLLGESRYYFDLEPLETRGSPEGTAIYRVSGQLRNYGGADAAAIRLVTVAYDASNRVLAQRQAELAVNILKAGAITPFEIDLLIPAGTVDHFEVLAQGLIEQSDSP